MKDRSRVAWCVLVAASAAVLAGCVSVGSSASPTPVVSSGLASPAASTPGASAAASAPASAGPGASSGAVTITDWGTIHDAVPAGFPLPPGAEPADLPEGPYSGAFTVGTSAADAAATVESGLRDAGWTDVTASGPTEAGEITIDAATGSSAGCRARVSVRPLGGLTAVVVLYGAACP